MKRERGIVFTLLVVSNAFSQNFAFKKLFPEEVNVKHLIRQNQINVIPGGDKVNTASHVDSPPTNLSPKSRTSFINNWSNFSTSSNIKGVLISYCKPLQYNDELNTVSFIHSKPASYVANPLPSAESASGLMVASITSDWGNTWDSTLIWNNSTYWGRHPGGGIYNPPGNHTLSSAYFIGHGPTTSSATGWPGNFFASKRLNVFSNMADTAAGAQQWMDVMNPNQNVGRVDFAAYGFSTTDDGKVRALGGVLDGSTGSDSSIILLTGSFNSGTFNYTGTSFFIPATLASDSSKNFVSRPMMAWNESGTIGYFAVIGQKIGAMGSNAGLQPMIWKTTNSGASWLMIPEINFNDAAFDGVKRSLPSTVNNSTLIVPYFSWLEGMDMTVDANNILHFFTTVYGSPRVQVDSVFYLYDFLNGGQSYKWPHVPGFRPYLYDFLSDGANGWTYKTIDSMSSESPSGLSSGNGFNENPWDMDGVDKPRLDARLQMSRTPDGRFIHYSWTESDTNYTSGAVKWNSMPDLKVRSYSVDFDTVFKQQYNVTGTYPVDQNLHTRAFFHFMSPRSSHATLYYDNHDDNTYVSVKIPFTITNSPGLNQLSDNSHWYNTAQLMFSTLGVTVDEINMAAAEQSYLFPNPSSQYTTLFIQLKENENLGVTIYNLMGQATASFETECQKEENKILIDLHGIESGMYMVKVNVGNTSSTKKLIIE